MERLFTAAERGTVTVLFGGLTATHDRLITAACETCGHRAEHLPQADLEAFEVGRQYWSRSVERIATA